MSFCLVSEMKAVASRILVVSDWTLLQGKEKKDYQDNDKRILRSAPTSVFQSGQILMGLMREKE